MRTSPGSPSQIRAVLFGLGAIQMTVKTVVGEVGCSPFKPARKGWVAPSRERCETVRTNAIHDGLLLPRTLSGSAFAASAMSPDKPPAQLIRAALAERLRGRIEHTLLLQHALDRCVGALAQRRLHKALTRSGLSSRSMLLAASLTSRVVRMPQNRVTSGNRTAPGRDALSAAGGLPV